MGWRRVVAQGSLGIWLVACAGSVRSGPSETIRVFGAADTPITATGVTADEDGWRIERASAGPVPLFEVDDVHSARREFEAAGVDVVGSTEHDSRWEWIHVRAPDGNLYEFASRLPEPTRP